MTICPGRLPGAPPAARWRSCRRSAALSIALLASALVASTTPGVAWGIPQHGGAEAITPDELLSDSLLGTGEGAAVHVTANEVLGLSPEMREFLANHVNRRGSGKVKLHNLVTAVIDSGTFGLEYDDTTRSAAETFRLRRGNCLSFSMMFLVLARHVGLDARFQEVEVPPAWTLDNETFVLNRHINVYLDLGMEGTRVVDFNIGDFRSSYPMRRISDSRGLAHYCNNVGVERMNAGDTAAAFAHFRTALADNDRDFAPAWTNLGTLYQRGGHIAHAEAAYLQALEASRWDLVAMSNLARLYERMGDRERAAGFREKVVYHRLQNPYYRYNLARDAVAAGDLDAAVAHLRFAVRKRPTEDQFCFLLGVAYLRQGDEKEAKRWFEQAEKVAASDTLKFRYSAKIDMLIRNNSGGGTPKNGGEGGADNGGRSPSKASAPRPLSPLWRLLRIAG
jgi:Flp pilus assembly protein TadD